VERTDKLTGRADYVFDGTSPPYTPSAATNPLNLYGQTKRDGEEAVLSIDGVDVVVLRVPVLYVSLLSCFALPF
jgi:dTDP-4-dehydrorhamnose reductase